MLSEMIQSALTATIEIVAIAGFGGIALHAIYTSHKRFMAEFCPPVAPYTPETQKVDKVDKTLESPDIPALFDPWESESDSQQQPQRLPSRHFSPVLALPAAKEVPAVVEVVKRKPGRPKKSEVKPKAQPKRNTRKKTA